MSEVQIIQMLFQITIYEKILLPTSNQRDECMFSKFLFFLVFGKCVRIIGGDHWQHAANSVIHSQNKKCIGA